MKRLTLAVRGLGPVCRTGGSARHVPTPVRSPGMTSIPGGGSVQAPVGTRHRSGESLPSTRETIRQPPLPGIRLMHSFSSCGRVTGLGNAILFYRKDPQKASENIVGVDVPWSRDLSLPACRAPGRGCGCERRPSVLKLISNSFVKHPHSGRPPRNCIRREA